MGSNANSFSLSLSLNLFHISSLLSLHCSLYVALPSPSEGECGRSFASLPLLPPGRGGV